MLVVQMLLWIMKILDDLVTIKSLNSTWIQLRNAKDEIVYSSLMNLNDEYTYSIT